MQLLDKWIVASPSLRDGLEAAAAVEAESVLVEAVEAVAVPPPEPPEADDWEFETWRGCCFQ